MQSMSAHITCGDTDRVAIEAMEKRLEMGRNRPTIGMTVASLNPITMPAPCLSRLNLVMTLLESFT